MKLIIAICVAFAVSSCASNCEVRTKDGKWRSCVEAGKGFG